MARKRESAVAGTVEMPVDIRDQVRAEAIARANAELPEDIRRLTPAQCLAKLREMGGAARIIPFREPGDDEDGA